MFALPMTVSTDRQTVTLQPFSRHQAAEIAQYWKYDVVKFLGQGQRAQTPETEEAWYDSMVADESTLLWGLFVEGSDGSQIHVGNTSLSKDGDLRYTSGILIWRQDHWGTGIASAAHLARTKYAVERCDAISIGSEVFDGNIASSKAITKLGYVKTGDNYRKGFNARRALNSEEYLWVNPYEPVWSFFWNGLAVPEAFVEARQVALDAMIGAHKQVRYL